MSEKNKPTELYITRIYNANPKQVWEAWVNPEQVAQWWGPRGFTLTTVRKEVRTDGDWLYTMHGPDGVDYPNHTKFLAVDPARHLIYDHGGFEDKPPMFRVEVFFHDLNGKTEMEMTMAFSTAEAASEARKFIKLANGDSTWDRLAEFLEKQNSGKDIFVINRSFDANKEALFALWTNPKHVMNWTPPTGQTGEFLKADIRPGGESFYKMSGNGITLYGKANYVEMVQPSRLVYVQRFADSEGNTARHPMAPTWPEAMKTTVSFFEEGDGQTRVALTWEVHGEASPDERDMFKGAKAGMTQGWTGSFDKLDEYLKKMQ
jgi:uncharacterized protein YndB with AHSA1/START domain